MGRNCTHLCSVEERMKMTLSRAWRRLLTTARIVLRTSGSSLILLMEDHVLHWAENPQLPYLSSFFFFFALFCDAGPQSIQLKFRERSQECCSVNSTGWQDSLFSPWLCLQVSTFIPHSQVKVCFLQVWTCPPIAAQGQKKPGFEGSGCFSKAVMPCTSQLKALPSTLKVTEECVYWLKSSPTLCSDLGFRGDVTLCLRYIHYAQEKGF